jgi:hypothetical protein
MSTLLGCMTGSGSVVEFMGLTDSTSDQQEGSHAGMLSTSSQRWPNSTHLSPGCLGVAGQVSQFWHCLQAHVHTRQGHTHCPHHGVVKGVPGGTQQQTRRP